MSSELKSAHNAPVVWVNPAEFDLCQTTPIIMNEHNELLNGMPRQIAALAARTDHCSLALMPATPTPPASEQQQAVFAIPDMDEHLLEILGRPNFRCSHIAQVLRLGGAEIKRKSEHEQAAVIHWMLTLYLAHGAAWWEVATDEIKRIQSEQPAAPRQGGDA